jgi:hypothetical protein
MDLILLTTGPEWDYMWDWLAKHPINDNLSDPTLAMNNNEAWQYMGTITHDNRFIHQLRHRCHPMTNEVKELYLKASDGFKPNEEIVKTFKLK